MQLKTSFMLKFSCDVLYIRIPIVFLEDKTVFFQKQRFDPKWCLSNDLQICPNNDDWLIFYIYI